VPVLIASTAFLPLVLLDAVVSQREATMLLLVAGGYTVWMVRTARDTATVSEARADTQIASEVADAAGAPTATSPLRSAVIAGVGLLFLLIGGSIFVEGAVSVAHSLGMSDRLVGLTIVAVGTSLPELVTSIIAARRGYSDIAIGNVLGSNIFNALLCLGASALAGSVGIPLASLTLDLTALAIMTLLVVVFMCTGRIITRSQGARVICLYAAFTAVAIARG
jgi:cation:H+ antiporter